jgi:hypothetical protein
MKAPQYTLCACVDQEELQKRMSLEPERHVEVWVIQAIPRHAEQLLRYLSSSVPLGRELAHLKRGHRDSTGAVNVLLALVSADDPEVPNRNAHAVLERLGVARGLELDYRVSTGRERSGLLYTGPRLRNHRYSLRPRSARRWSSSNVSSTRRRAPTLTPLLLCVGRYPAHLHR